MEPRPNEATWRHGWVAMAIGLLVLLVPFSTKFQSHGGPMDEGVLLVYPEMVQRGAIPYRDFETFYGPANPYVLAAVYSIFGTKIEVERTMGLLYRALILIALFGLLRRWGTAIAMGCMLLAGVLLLPLGIVAFAWSGAIACALSFIWAMAAPKNNRQGFAGALAGLALAFRVDVGLGVALAAWTLLQPISSGQRLKFAFGAALGLVPFVVLLFLTGPQQMFNNLFLYPVIISGPARRLPLFGAEPFLVQIFFGLVVAAAANFFVWFFAVRARPTEWRNRTLLAVALLGVGVLPQAWQRLDIFHLMQVAFLVMGILPLTLLSIVSRRFENRPPIWLALGATLIAASLVSVVAPVVPRLAIASFREGLQTTPLGAEFVSRGQRSFPVRHQNIESVRLVLDKLEQLSKPGERLFVGPGDLLHPNYCDSFIYHLMPQLQPATYFLEMNPLSANRPGSRLASDIASADWLVLNHEWDPADEPNRSTEHGSAEALSVVKDHFYLAAQHGSFALFRRSR